MDYSTVIQTDKGVELRDIRCFELADILDCGQSFRWKPEAQDTYTGFAQERFLRISKQGSTVLFHNISMEDFEGFWRNYFDLDRDYGDLQELFMQDPVMAKAVAFAPGIRVLRQHSWEALCSFILSQNNNIIRIKGLVERLCENFGKPIDQGFGFPAPQALAQLDVEDLAPVRSGFRAKYVIDAARRVSGGELDLTEVYSLPLEEARSQLQQIHGVGPKVADCALLYGFGRAEVIPMDVWMKRALAGLYPEGFPDKLRPWAGLAQQYLFHYVRNCPDALAIEE